MWVLAVLSEVLMVVVHCLAPLAVEVVHYLEPLVLPCAVIALVRRRDLHSRPRGGSIEGITESEGFYKFAMAGGDLPPGHGEPSASSMQIFTHSRI